MINKENENYMALLNPVLKSRINSAKPYFVGFNTVGKSGPPYTLTNIELVKRDIQNQFATTLGERVMLPNFGTRIPELLFDPFDDYTKGAIIEDAVRVVESEPRVELVNIDTYKSGQTLVVLITLLFKPESVTEDLYVTFTAADQSAF